MAVSGPIWMGQSHIKGSTESMRMMLLTFASLGLQFCWGTEMTYGTPYLLSLGMSKSKLSLVWVAGPLSGLVMQPVVGLLSDRCTNRWGRRRPFMMAGTFAVVVCLLILGWTEAIVKYFVGDEERIRSLTVVLAVVDIYILDFMINISQSACRALVTDALPAEKQQLGSAWCSRMAGFGQMLVYGLGAIDLQHIFGPLLGDSQFKQVCATAAIAMLIAQGTTCWAVSERILTSPPSQTPTSNNSITSILKQISHTTLNLPDGIRAICHVQLWSWIGWFPFLFYGSTWVGELYLLSAPTTRSKQAILTETGRHASQAFMLFSILNLLGSIFLPSLLYDPSSSAGLPAKNPIHSKKPTLKQAWRWSNFSFAALMALTPFISSFHLATILIALCAFPWSVAGLAPGTFLGVQVNRLASLPLDDEQGDAAGIYFGILNIYTTIPQFLGTGISWVVFSVVEGLGLGGGGIAACLCIGAGCAFRAGRECRFLRE